MDKLEIREVNSQNIDDLINLCIPSDKKNDLLFVEGMKAKKKWATQAIEKYGSIAKLAYLNSKPVGLIQYQPDQEERLVKISCIVVSEKENFRKGEFQKRNREISVEGANRRREKTKTNL